MFRHTQKRFFIFKWNFFCFSLWPLSLYSFCQVFTHVGKIPLSLLCSWLNNLNSLSLSLPYKCPNLLITFVVFCWTCSSMFMSLVLAIPEQDKVFQMWPHQGQVEAKFTSSDLLEMLCPTAAQETADLLCLKGHSAGLHSAWYSPGSQVFSCSLNNKIVSYTIMKGSYVISSFK